MGRVARRATLKPKPFVADQTRMSDSSAWRILRDRRDPEFWFPLILVLLVVIPVGWAGISWTESYLAELQRHAQENPKYGVEEGTALLRLVVRTFAAGVLCFAIYLFLLCRQAREEAQLPPSGWWSLGAWRARVGESARTRAQWGMRLSVFLALLVPTMLLLLESVLQTLLSS